MDLKFITFSLLLLLIKQSNVFGKLSVDNDLNEIIQNDNLHIDDKPLVRERRLANPLGGIFGFFTTLGNIKRLFNDQHNETTYSLQRVYDLLADGFTDTATKKPYTPAPPTSMPVNQTNSTEAMSTTTEKYRISRKELGYILGRNYRGLRKLFRIELNDALNQSKYNIKEYKNELGVSLARYTIPKELPPTTTTEADN